MNEIWILKSIAHLLPGSQGSYVCVVVWGWGMNVLVYLAQNSWSGDNNLFPHPLLPISAQCPKKELQVLMLVKLNSFQTPVFSLLSIFLLTDNWERRWKKLKSKMAKC